MDIRELQFGRDYLHREHGKVHLVGGHPWDGATFVAYRWDDEQDDAVLFFTEACELGPLDYDALLKEIAGLKTKLQVLEAARPHWAKGFTDDGVAAQSFSNALSSIWKALGVDNQTDAMQKLEKLIAGDDPVQLVGNWDDQLERIIDNVAETPIRHELSDYHVRIRLLLRDGNLSKMNGGAGPSWTYPGRKKK